MMADLAHKSALITGVSGFAGRQLAALLVNDGWQVSGTVNSRTSKVEGVDERQIQIDDRDHLAELIEATDPSIVYHLAAIVDTVSTPDVMELHRVNTTGTVAVTDALETAGSKARLVFASSAFAYGRVSQDDAPILETTPLNPVTPYGASKVASEAIVWQHARGTGREVVVTRAFQHTGPHHTGAYALADWARQLALIERSGGSGQIATGDLSVARDYLDVRDVAAAYRAAGEHGRAGQTYNVSSGVPVTMRALLEGLITAFGVDAEIVTDKSRLRKVDQPFFYGSCDKLRADTQWRPGYPLEQTLADLAAYWRDRVRSEVAQK